VGPRRVALACAEDARPAACCIVDALVARGYDVVLHTGIDARSALRPAPDDPGRLRVLWIPDHHRPTKDQLRRALDPNGAGDVLVLCSPTPRGVIESIEAFASGRERARTRSGPRRTYLEHPTRVESSLELRRIGPAVVGAVAATAALLVAVKLGSPERTIASAQPATETSARAAKPSPRRGLDPSVLGSAMTPLDDADAMTDEAPRRARTRRAPSRPPRVEPTPALPVSAPTAELAPAPLEEDVRRIEAGVSAPTVPVLAAPTLEAVRALRPEPRVIDPFAP